MVSRPTVLAEVAVAVAPAFGAAGPAGAAVAREPLFGGSATALECTPAVSGLSLREGMGAAGASMGSAVCGSDAASQERRMFARCMRAGFGAALGSAEVQRDSA